MKKFLLLLMLLCSIRVSAQDVIVKKDGSTIVCRVVEVGKTVITYKKWSNLKGPNYVIEKTEVTSVNYQNGEKDVFEEEETPTPAPTPTPTPTPVQVTTFTPMVQGNSGQQTVSDDMLLKMVGKLELTPQQKKVKRLKMAGWICGGVLCAGGLAMTIGGATGEGKEVWNGSVYDELANWPLLGIGLGTILGGSALTWGCLYKASKINKQVSPMSVHSAPVFQQNFYLKNGTSLSPSINMMKDNTRRNTTLGIGLSYNF